MEHSGFLWKRGPKRSGYKLRFFQLRGKYLRYFKREGDGMDKELGHIRLDRCINLWMNSDSDPPKPTLAGFVFSMDVMQDSGIPREYVFCALDDDSKLRWLELLQESINQHRGESNTKGSDITVSSVKKELHLNKDTKMEEIMASLQAAQPGGSRQPALPPPPSMSSNPHRGRSATTRYAGSGSSPRAAPPPTVRRNTASSALQRANSASQISRLPPPSPGVRPSTSHHQQSGILSPRARPPPPSVPVAAHSNQPPVRPVPAQRAPPSSAQLPDLPPSPPASRPNLPPKGQVSPRRMTSKNRGGSGVDAGSGTSSPRGGSASPRRAASYNRGGAVSPRSGSSSPRSGTSSPRGTSGSRSAGSGSGLTVAPTTASARRRPTPPIVESLPDFVSDDDTPDDADDGDEEFPDTPAPLPPPGAGGRRGLPSHMQSSGSIAEMTSSGYEDLEYLPAAAEADLDQDTEEAPDLGYEEAEQRLAVFDFDAEDVDQMSLSAGDKLVVVETDGEWIKCTNVVSGCEGWVPVSYTAPV